MSSRNVFITGVNNVVENVTGMAAINVSGETFTSSDSGKIFLNSKLIWIDENGLNATVVPPIQIVTAATWQTDSTHEIYLADATLANITITLRGTGIKYTIIKTDVTANTVTLSPESGNINGNPTYVLTSQYQGVTVAWDGTNWYFPTIVAAAANPFTYVNQYSTASSPGIVAGPALGTGPTVAIVGTNKGGKISVTPGTGVLPAGIIATVTFSGAFAFPTDCNVTIRPHNINAIGEIISSIFEYGTTTTFVLEAGVVSLLVVGTLYEFNYVVEGY